MYAIPQGYEVEFDPRTEVRSPLSRNLRPAQRKKLAQLIEAGRATVEEPLTGWPGVTHRVKAGCRHFHVQLEGGPGEE